MNESIIYSLIIGALLGVAYGVLFVRRMAAYAAFPPQQTEDADQKKPLLRAGALVFSFMLSYVFAGITLLIAMRFFNLRLLWCTLSFFALFWATVLRYTRKLV